MCAGAGAPALIDAAQFMPDEDVEQLLESIDQGSAQGLRNYAILLRHSLATRLLRNGASLTEIGELLRHRDLNTTQIYAKVDHRALRALAPPWPGGEA